MTRNHGRSTPTKREVEKLPHRKTYHMISFICGIFFFNEETNLFIKHKQVHECRKQIYGYWGIRGKDISGDWDRHIHTTVYNIDNE